MGNYMLPALQYFQVTDSSPLSVNVSSALRYMMSVGFHSPSPSPLSEKDTLKLAFNTSGMSLQRLYFLTVPLPALVSFLWTAVLVTMLLS